MNVVQALELSKPFKKLTTKNQSIRQGLKL